MLMSKFSTHRNSEPSAKLVNGDQLPHAGPFFGWLSMCGTKYPAPYKQRTISLKELQYKSAFVEDDADLGQYQNIISRRKWHVLVFILFVTLSSGFLANSIAPIYQAKATLLIEIHQTKLLPIKDFYNQPGDDKQFYQTQLEILKSRKMIVQVIHDLKLDSNPEFLSEEKSSHLVSSVAAWLAKKNVSANKPYDHFDLLVKYVEKKLTVKLIKGTQLITISFESESPKLAAQIANALARAYIHEQLNIRIESAKKAVKWIEKRLKILKLKLRTSEQDMQRYMQRNGLIDVAGVRTLTAKELDDLTSQMVIIRSKYIKLSKRYGNKHPKIIAVKSEILAVKIALQRTEAKIQNIGRKEVKMREFKRRVNSDRMLYDTFVSHLKDASQAMDIESVNIRISDPAVAPLEPSKPKKVLIVFAAFLGSLMLGLLLAFLYEVLDKTFKTTKDIEQKLKQPVLGLLPLIKKKKNEDNTTLAFAMLDPDQKIFAEAIHTIRTELILSDFNLPHKLILITSSISGEGKTLLSINLAIAMAKMEKVLLIEADLRRPSISQALSLDRDQPGINNIVTDLAEFQDYIQHINQLDIDLLPCGSLPSNPLEILSSKRFKMMLSALATHYDRIIIDSPPTHAVSDTLILSQLADTVVYVIEANATSEEVVKNALKRLLQHNAPVAGVVLNKCNAKELATYGYQFDDAPY